MKGSSHVVGDLWVWTVAPVSLLSCFVVECTEEWRVPLSTEFLFFFGTKRTRPKDPPHKGALDILGVRNRVPSYNRVSQILF